MTSRGEKVATVLMNIVLITSLFAGFVTMTGPAAAASNLPINQEFDTGSPTDWNFYDQAVSDTPVDGKQSLELTSTGTDEKGTALYTNSFDSSNGITAEFRYYAADGTGGADGLSFFLLDASKVDPATFSSGPSGRALGYDYDSDSDTAGIEGGYLGFGFDEFGDFDEKDSDSQDVAIRGQGDASADKNDYPVIADADPAQNVDGGWRRARVTVDPNAGGSNEVGLQVEMSWDGGSTWQTQIDQTVTESTTIGGSIPDDFYLGFSGSTGSSTNTHAVDWVDVTKPTDLTTTVTSAPANDPYHAGETVEYSFEVENKGPNDDSSITLDPTVTEGVSGLENLEWDTNNDDDFSDDTGSSTTISLNSGNTQTVQLRGTVGNDATGNLDHDITATPSSGFNDPNPSDNDKSVSVNLNAAPSFASNENLANINEDPSTNDGSQIDSNELFGDEFSDTDGDGFAGIAVTNNAADSSTEGTWQYSTDGGSTWTDIGESLSSSSGLVLSATDRLRFDPVENYNGDPGKLTVFAVDDSKGAVTTGNTYDTTSDGKSSIAAESSNTVGITVDPVNDAPTFDNGSPSVTVDEDKTADINSELSVIDPDTGDTLTWTVSSSPNYGTLSGFSTTETSDGSSVTPSGLSYDPPGAYSSSDSFDIQIGDGSTTDTVTVSVTINDVTAPTADASNSDSSGDEDTSISFDGGASSDNDNIAKYEWDWTNDGSYEDTGETLTHTYADPGTYTVALRVTDDADNTDTTTHSVTVNDVTAPTADASNSDTSGNEDTSISFDGTASTDNDNIAKYEWDWTNDGSYEDSGATASHTYADPGTYTVALRVTDDDDNTDTTTHSVTVNDKTDPIADASDSDSSGDEDAAINFDGGASTDNGNIVKYEWDWTNDGSYEDTGETLTHTYADPGTYTVALRVTDDDDNTATNTHTVTVNDVTDPTADAGDDVQTNWGEESSLDGSASTDNDNIASYDWDVDGDGNYELSGVSPKHSYEEAGTHTVTLRVTDDGGNTGTDTLTVEVWSSDDDKEEEEKREDTTAPTANAGENITVDRNEVFTLDGTESTDNVGVEAYRWDYTSDGSTDARQATTETLFSEAGTYTATLTVEDEAGNTGTDTVTIVVRGSGQPPVADAGDVAVDEGVVAYASAVGGERNEIRATDGSAVTAEFADTSKALGPALEDLTGDGSVDLPYVVFNGPNAGNLQTIDADGETTTLVAQGQNADGTDPAQSKSILGVGRWQESPLSVFYVNKSKTGIYRVAPGSSPTEVAVPDDGAEAVLGTADIDGDDGRELVFLDSSQAVQYLDGDGNANSTGVTVGSNNGLGAGEPADFDGDGTARVPIVTDSGDLALVGPDGATTLTDRGSAEKAPVAASDLDGDGAYELAFVTGAPDDAIRYLDDVGGSNTVTDTSGDAEAFDRAGVAASATSQTADQVVEPGESVEFDASNSTALEGEIASYEWDIDGDGTYEESGQSVTHNYSEAGTYTARLRVTDGQGLTDTDTYTVVVERSQAAINAGLAPMPTYHGNLASTGNYDAAGPKTEPEILWNKSTNAIFPNQPIIADGTLYVASHNGGELQALDPGTGEQQWAAMPGGTWGTTWSAPAVVDGTLYLGTNNRTFHALDADSGEELGYFGVSTQIRSAPAVLNGTVYFGANEGTMYAVNTSDLRQGSLRGLDFDAEPPASGDERWAHTEWRDHAQVKSNPAVVNGVVYYGSHNGNVTALDAASGERVWQFQTPTEPGRRGSTRHAEVMSDPTVVDGTVYIGSDSLKQRTNGDGHIHALDAETGEEQWSHTLTGDVDSGQAYADGVVYAGSRGGDFVALDAEDGSVVWEYSGGDFYGAPVVADGVVYVNDFGQSQVKAFDAESGDQLWAFDSPKEWLYGTPLVHDGKLYYGGNDEFYALSQPTISVSSVNVTNPDGQTIDVAFETTKPAKSIEASVSGAESATLDASDFEETETDAGTYRYTATYEGSNYGTYNVSVEVTSDDEETASGEDGVVVREPLGVTTSGGELSFDAGTDPVVVDSNIVVNGGDDQTVEGAKVIVDDGFRDGDTLSYDDSSADGSGISGSYNDEKGILTFSGAATPKDYQAVLRSVTFASAKPEEPSTTDREISFSLGARASYSAATGHYYEYVDKSGLTWNEASDAASEKTYFGQQGYLVTVTSADENTFVSEKIDGKSWMGASDEAAEGTWRWVTGPEKLEDGEEGRHFFDQTSSVDGDEYGGATPGGGTTVDGEYENWANGEPNHWGSGENYAHFYADGEWNDFAEDNSRVQGYVVEYGGMPGDPEVDLSDTTDVTVTAEDSESPTADAGGNVSTKEGTAAVFDASGSTDNVGIANYTWEFGDGTTGSGEKTTHVYDEAGTYEATLTVTDEAGNTDTATITVTVEDVTLVAKTGFEDETVSAGETVEFDATASDSSEGIDSYAWDFGNDGETDATRPVQSVEYQTAGTYATKLTVTDELGNTASTVAEVTVEDSTPPSADAGEQRRSVDEDESVTFDASGSSDNDDIARHAWDFNGDGESDATGETVDHTFADPGVYHVELTVTDESGNTDSTVQTVEVADVTAPEADAGEDFTVNQSEAGTLDASASSDNVEIVQYGWDLTGDGNIDRTGETISGSYDRPGVYDVTLLVRDAANNTNTDTVSVTVRDSEPPEVDLQTTTLTGETNQTITFDASNSTDNVGVASYEWTFGDGTTETTRGGVGGGGATIDHTYDEDGEFDVTVTAVDNAGNAATDTVSVTVLDTSTLTAAIGTGNTTTLSTGENVTFDASGSQSSSDIESYEWDLDSDGETDATGPTVTTSYDELGNHTAEVTITDPAGNTATTTQTVTVVDTTPPTATTANEERTVAEDESATFDATGSSDNGDIASYEWDFTGDSQTDATGAEPNYTFTDPGEYLVTLTVTDSEGNTDTTTMTVTVTDETAPQVVVDQPEDVPQNERFTLDAGRTTDNGDIASYEWDLDGDGEADLSGETATKAFEKVGTREVTVTVTDEAGNSQSQTVDVEVTDATPPIADAGSSLSALKGAAVDFDASESTDNIGVASYEWDFGDGNTATGETPTHTYDNDGRYTVELTAIDEAGNEATDTVRVAVIDGALLLADAGKSRIEAEQGQAVEFDATGSDSDGGLASYEWDFDGDGEFEGTGPTPTHEFTEAGTHTVTLRVTDDAGNTVTDTVTVDVTDTTDPLAVLGTPGTAVAEDRPVAFHGSQSEDNTGVDRYEWDFDGDGVTDSTARNPTHVFEEPGTYEVTLTVTDGGGNTDTTTETIVVTDETPPTVDIGSGTDEIEAGQSVSFVASGSTDNDEIASYEWDFGDGETASGPEASHSYNSAGEYTVTATVTDEAGNEATDTVTVVVEARATLQADAGPSKTAAPGEELTFDGTDSTASDGVASYRWTFDDGSANTQPVTRHAFLERGNYTVTLEITDPSGRTATDTTNVTVRDQERPKADAGSDQQIVVGNKVQLYAGDSFDNRGISEYQWDMGDGNSIASSQPTVSYWYNEPGTYPVTLTTIDDAGNTDSDVVVIEVLPEGEATANETETVQVNVESNESEAVETVGAEDGLRIRVTENELGGSSSDAARPVSSQSVSIENVTEGSRLSVSLSGESEESVDGSGNIFVDRLDLQSNSPGTVDLNVETSEINLEAVTGAQQTQTKEQVVEEGVNVSGIDRETIDMTTEALSPESQEFVNETGTRPAGFIDIEHDISDEDVSNVTHHFRVRKSYLNATGVGPDAVTLYRDEQAGQNNLDTELVAETDEFYHYQSDSPGLSRFTIGTRTPIYELTDARIVGDEIVAGEEFTVETTVTNVGTANGTYEALLIADGEVVTATSIALDAGERQTVQMNHTFTESGNHSLSIGNLDVEIQDVTPDGSDDGLGLFAYLLVFAVLVLVLLLIAGWRRRRDDEDDEYPLHT